MESVLRDFTNIQWKLHILPRGSKEEGYLIHEVATVKGSKSYVSIRDENEECPVVQSIHQHFTSASNTLHSKLDRDAWHSHQCHWSQILTCKLSSSLINN